MTKAALRAAGLGLMLAIVPAVAVSGLTLYRYLDTDGRVIVVDRLEKVPLDRRSTVRSETIRSGRPQSRQTSQRDSSGTLEAPAVEFVLPIAIPEPERRGDELIATGEVKIDVEHASATLWLNGLTTMFRQSEELWHTTMAFSVFHRRVVVLQEENLRLLEGLRELERMSWKGHEDWVQQARGVTDQLRQLSYSVSLWLRQNPGRVKTDLPPLLNRLRMVIGMLERALPPANTGK
ncbi:MAG TPA: hypothetical protein PLP29_11240 [Candidatus Ozemobacteraceae bacterium]|nr:hypothetical protein [Candidatus Ozemobacteraceae bacterium]